MTTRRFAGSFRKVSQKKNCTKLKDHYTGAMHELVGILDLWAANDAERFVFARVSAIRKQCKYFKSDKSYGPRWIEKGLAELRARNIVSKRLMRIRNHEEVWGYIVAPHDCLTMHVGGKCILTGQLGEGTSGRWARTWDGSPDSVLYWAGYSDGKPGNRPVAKPVSGPVCRPVPRPVHKPGDRPVTTLQHDSDKAEVSLQNPALTVVAVETAETAETVPALPADLTQPSAAQEKAKAGRQGRVGTSRSSNPPPAWLEFIKAARQYELCGEMLHAEPLPGEHAKVLAQLALRDGDVESLCDEIDDWAVLRSPPLREREYGRWTLWLATQGA